MARMENFGMCTGGRYSSYCSDCGEEGDYEWGFECACERETCDTCGLRLVSHGEEKECKCEEGKA